MKKLLAAMFMAGVLAVTATPSAGAQGVWETCPEDVRNTSTVCGDQSDATDIVKFLINAFLFVIGILSVIMIVHSGLKYVNSRGDAEQVKSAKNTLLYSVVGLIVAMLAFTIVNFVIGLFLQADTGTTTGQTTTKKGSNA